MTELLSTVILIVVGIPIAFVCVGCILIPLGLTIYAVVDSTIIEPAASTYRAIETLIKRVTKR